MSTEVGAEMSSPIVDNMPELESSSIDYSLTDISITKSCTAVTSPSPSLVSAVDDVPISVSQLNEIKSIDQLWCDTCKLKFDSLTEIKSQYLDYPILNSVEEVVPDVNAQSPRSQVFVYLKSIRKNLR